MAACEGCTKGDDEAMIAPRVEKISSLLDSSPSPPKTTLSHLDLHVFSDSVERCSERLVDLSDVSTLTSASVEDLGSSMAGVDLV